MPSISAVQSLITSSRTQEVPGGLTADIEKLTKPKIPSLDITRSNAGVPKSNFDLAQRARELLDTRFAALDRLRGERQQAANRSSAYASLVDELKNLQTAAEQLRTEKKFESYRTEKETVTQTRIVLTETNTTEEIGITKIFNNKLRLSGGSGLANGTEIVFTDAIPGSDIVAGQKYYLRKVDDSSTDFRVFTTYEKAVNNSAVGREAVFFDRNTVDAKVARNVKKIVNSEITETVTRDVQKRDTDKAREAVTGFIDQYNRVQSLISNLTGSTTDAKGNTVSGPLRGESPVNGIRSALRSALGGLVSELPNNVKTSGKNSQIELSDFQITEGSIDRIANYFLKTGTGVADRISGLVSQVTADNGPIAGRISSLDAQVGRIGNQITRLESKAAEERQKLEEQIEKSAKSLNQVNQNVKFLSGRFSAAQ